MIEFWKKRAKKNRK